MTGTTKSYTSGVMGIDVPVDLPDKVVVAVGVGGDNKLHIPHPRREKYCYRPCRELKEKPIEVYPPVHRRWCQLCVQLQWEDYSMMRDDILDYIDSHPDATPKEVAENVEGANPYTVRTVLDGEGIEPTEPEPMDGGDAGAAESVSHADAADDSEEEDTVTDDAVMVYRTETGGKYHLDFSCGYLRGEGIETRLSEAEGDGLEACGACSEGVDVKHGSTGTGTVLQEGETEETEESSDDQAVEPRGDTVYELGQQEWLEVLRACAKQEVEDEVLAKVAAHAGGER